MTRVPICPSCIYFNDDSDHLSCEAFPEGIPKDIFWIKADESGRLCCKDDYRFIDIDKK